MRTKKSTLLFAAMLCGATLSAQTQVLSVYKTDGTKETITLSDVERVAFDEQLTDEAFTSGEGTAESPYVISDVKGLQAMAELVNSGDSTFMKANYELASDIDLWGTAWTPIGTGQGNTQIGLVENGAFMGTFNGNGHTISGLTIDATSDETIAMQGLFGLVKGGTVKNLTVKGTVKAVSTATSETDNVYLVVGGIVGYGSFANIDQCSFEGNVSAESGVQGTAITVGGVVGYMIGTLTNCTTTLQATQSITATGSYANAGGLAGYVNAGSVQYCVATIKGQLKADCGSETVIENSSACAGGLIGNSFGGSTQQCVATIDGTVSAYAVPTSGAESAFTTAAAGGIAGSFSADKNSLNTVTVSGTISAEGCTTGAAGGVIGSQESAGYGANSLTATIAGTVSAATHNSSTKRSIAYAGGIYGHGSFQYSSAMQNCSATVSGTVTAKGAMAAYTGGMAGGSGPLTACHATVTSSGKLVVEAPTLANCGGVVGLPNGKVGACYAIVDGQLAVGESESSNLGGVIGGISGNKRSPKPVTGCYALIGGTVEKAEETNLGGVAGMAGSYVDLLGCYWWSSSDAIVGSSNSDETTDDKIASRDEAGLTAILEAMNTALEEDGSYTCQYVYDSTTNTLTVVSTATEGE